MFLVMLGSLVLNTKSVSGSGGSESWVSSLTKDFERSHRQ